MGSHSNDGAGDAAANLRKIPPSDWPKGSRRPVQGGSIPQVAHTFGYFSGGYPSVNEWQVGLAESTCNAVISGNASGILNIVDLSGLALERANTSREAIRVMGQLADEYGYNDNGESLLVFDPNEAFVFHILPDSSRAHAVWCAQRVPDTHVAIIANAFNIHVIDTAEHGDRNGDFLYSANLKSEARKLGWTDGRPLDFTRIFSGPELGHKYASGRRMWMGFELLTGTKLNPHYTELISDAPYPTTMEVKKKGKVSAKDLMDLMRNRYQGTPFDMTTNAQALSSGPFQSPDRWVQPRMSQAVGNWERTIATHMSILSYVIALDRSLPGEIGATLWFAPHAAHTSFYVPFPVGIEALPVAFWNNSLNEVQRGQSAFQASRFVFNIAQMKFDSMIEDIAATQAYYESYSFSLNAVLQQQYAKTRNMTYCQLKYNANAETVVRAWWTLTDSLILKYADGFCNFGQCGKSGSTRVTGYPWVWLETVGYSQGPPPSPPVPPYNGTH